MLKVFVGEDRISAETALKRALGADYEVFEGENLAVTDLPSIFQGTSLFGSGERKILLKNLSENSVVWEKVADYAKTPHQVIIWEVKLDKRSAGYKNLKTAGVEIQEFALKSAPEAKLVFGILDLALRDGTKAIAQVEQLEATQDPYQFFGLMASQALKKFSARPGVRERALLGALAKLDLEMKTSALEPWMLVKAFLLQVSRLPK